MAEASLLVVTPQRSELDPLMEGVSTSGHEAALITAGRMHVLHVPSLGALFAVAGHGKAQFGLQTQHLIDCCEGLDTVVCAGAAGALLEGVRAGEVVVATATVEHDYRLRFVRSVLPRWEADEKTLAGLRAAAEQLRDLPVRFGPVASGDEDVATRARAEELARETGALCVAWEGAGGARAARFNGLRFIEIRGVTDAADGGAPGSYRENLKPVMLRIGRLIAVWQGSRRAASAML